MESVDFGVNDSASRCLSERLDRTAVGFFDQKNFVSFREDREQPSKGIGGGLPRWIGRDVCRKSLSEDGGIECTGTHKVPVWGMVDECLSKRFRSGYWFAEVHEFCGDLPSCIEKFYAAPMHGDWIKLGVDVV